MVFLLKIRLFFSQVKLITNILVSCFYFFIFGRLNLGVVNDYTYKGEINREKSYGSYN